MTDMRGSFVYDLGSVSGEYKNDFGLAGIFLIIPVRFAEKVTILNVE